MSLQNTRQIIIISSLFFSSFAYAAVKEYHLTIDEQNINLTGKTVKKIHVNGQFPAPTLEFEEGDDAVIHVHNNLKKTRYFSTLAWVIAPWPYGWCTWIQSISSH